MFKSEIRSKHVVGFCTLLGLCEEKEGGVGGSIDDKTHVSSWSALWKLTGALLRLNFCYQRMECKGRGRGGKGEIGKGISMNDWILYNPNGQPAHWRVYYVKTEVELAGGGGVGRCRRIGWVDKGLYYHLKQMWGDCILVFFYKFLNSLFLSFYPFLFLLLHW